MPISQNDKIEILLHVCQISYGTPQICSENPGHVGIWVVKAMFFMLFELILIVIPKNLAEQPLRKPVTVVRPWGFTLSAGRWWTPWRRWGLKQPIDAKTAGNPQLSECRAHDFQVDIYSFFLVIDSVLATLGRFTTVKRCSLAADTVQFGRSSIYICMYVCIYIYISSNHISQHDLSINIDIIWYLYSRYLFARYFSMFFCISNIHIWDF